MEVHDAADSVHPCNVAATDAAPPTLHPSPCASGFQGEGQPWFCSSAYQVVQTVM